MMIILKIGIHLQVINIKMETQSMFVYDRGSNTLPSGTPEESRELYEVYSFIVIL